MAKKKVSNRHEHHQEAPVPKGRLLAIGGHEDKGNGKLKEEQARNINFESEEILKFFVSELRGGDPMILIVPTASTVPEEISQDYREALGGLGAKHTEVLDIRNRVDARNPELLELVGRAAGIMFTGGDQLRLTSILGARPYWS